MDGLQSLYTPRTVPEIIQTGHVRDICDKGLDLPAGRLSGLVGKTVVRVDPRYFRPTEVETLLGNPAKARERLGWVPEISFAEMVTEMVQADLIQAGRDKLCGEHGYAVCCYNE